MSRRGSELLQDIYGVVTEKIDLIPHGIPDVPFVDPSFHKDLFGVEGKIVLLSFGLLSPDKGLRMLSLHCRLLQIAIRISYILSSVQHIRMLFNMKVNIQAVAPMAGPGKRNGKPGNIL